MKYRPEIDGLRAVAVVPVVLFHAGVAAFSGGFVGVDVFFVISGYLITSIIAEEIDSGSFSIVKFYERRARRILPALFAVCLACIPFAWLWMSPPEYKDFSQSLVGVALFSSNVLFWQESGYFSAAVELKPLLHTWSLAVEEQFYLFFPLLMLALRGSIYRVPLLLALCILSLASCIYLSSIDSTAAFYLIPTRAWELGVGALLALCPKARATTSMHSAGAGLGLAMICVAIAMFDESTPFPSYYALLPVVGTALIIRYGAVETLVGRVLSWKPLVAIGLISYSVYLWHQPLFAFLRLRSLYEPSALAMGLAIALTFILASLTWRFIEMPFRRRDRLPRRRIFALAAVASIGAIGVGSIGHITQGFESLTPARAQSSVLEAKLKHNRGLSNACEGPYTLANECRTSDEPEIAVWGDSFAMHLVPGLVASDPQVKLIQFTTSVCGPILDLAPTNATYGEHWARGCLDFNRKVFDWITSHPSVKHVVLSSPFAQYADGEWGFYTPEGLRPANFEFAVDRLAHTLDLLKSHGVDPVLVSPPPSTGGDIGRCLFRLHFLKVSGTCDFPESEYRHVNARRIRYLEELERRGHRVIWLDRVMCRHKSCLTAQNDIFFYRDAGHLSREGSALLGKEMHLLDLITRTTQSE